MKTSVLDNDVFSPDELTKADMKLLAGHIEEYLELFTDVMVIPEDIQSDQKAKIKEGIKRTKELIERLYKGDKSVFKDPDDVEPLW
jgi:hypothetical protein